MLRIDILTARPGMRLALSIRHPRQYDHTLLKLGYALTRQDIRRIKDLGVRTIWVQYPGLEFLSRIINRGVIDAQGSVLRQVAGVFEMVQAQTSADLPYREYRKTLEVLVSELVHHPKAAVFLGEMDELEKDDMIRHSATVTFLSLLIGLRLEGYLVTQRPLMNPALAKEVVYLGIGAMLHDVGITRLPEPVRETFRRTGDDSDPLWREHPAMGYELVHGQVTPTVASVVLNHHQNYDGTGYAGDNKPVLAGDKIHVFARIAALADRFDEMKRPVGARPHTTVGVLHDLLEPELICQFDPRVVRALLAVVPPYPPGTIVRLSDGQWVVAIDHAPAAPCRPTVQVIPSPDQLDPDEGEPLGPTINLGEEDESLYVAECDGQDVSEFNFPSLTELRDSNEAMAEV